MMETSRLLLEDQSLEADDEPFVLLFAEAPAARDPVAGM